MEESLMTVAVSYTEEEYYFRALENMLNSSEHVLRELFQVRWKKELDKEDWDYSKSTIKQVKQLFEKIGKHLNKLQKAKIQEGCLSDWDMTLLGLILTKYWDGNTFEIENEGVRKLKDLRNELAHDPSKSLTKYEYNKMVGKFRKELKILNVNDEDIMQMIKEAEAMVKDSSVLVCSMANISETTSWDKLSYGVKCVIRNRAVIFQGKTVRLDELKNPNLEALDGHILVKLAKGDIPIIVSNQVPNQIEYYINRKIHSRHKLTEEIFTSSGDDVFLVQGLQMWELTQLVKKAETDISANQIRNLVLTVRFILLEREQDFEKISKISTAPVHWLKRIFRAWHDPQYEWVKSSGSVKTLQEYVVHCDHILTPPSIVDQVVSRKNNVFVISGSPGMGKTSLLVDIAHGIMKWNGKMFVGYINMKEFVQTFYIKPVQIHVNSIVSSIAEQFSDFNFGRSLVESTLKNERCVLMFDGFDEVLPHHITLATTILKTMATLQLARVIVTTRPHMRDDLENALHSLGHTIKSIDESDQKRLLLKYWKSMGIEPGDHFASTLLKLLKSTTNDPKQEHNCIAAIPLQCRLLAETSLEEAKRCSNMRNQGLHNTNSQHSLFDMYHAHMNMRFKKICDDNSLLKRLFLIMRKNNNKKDQYEIIKTTHMYNALKLFLPDHLDAFKSLMTSSVSSYQPYDLGILEATNSNNGIRFVHRTFAEYLVAWFVAEADVDSASSQLILSQIFRTIPKNVFLSATLGLPEPIKSYRFYFPTICYFINEFFKRDCKWNTQLCEALSNLRTSNLSEQEQNQVTEIMFASAYHNYPYMLVAVSKLLGNRSKNMNDGEDKCLSDLLLVTAQHSDVELMKAVCKNRDLSKIQFKKSTMCYIGPVLINPLHVAVQRGHYRLVEYFINNFEFMMSDLSSLTHAVAFRSVADDSTTINEKQQIIKLLNVKRKLRNIEPIAAVSTGLPKPNVNKKLVECMLRAGMDVTVWDTKNGTELYKMNECTSARAPSPSRLYSIPPMKGPISCPIPEFLLQIDGSRNVKR